MYLHVHVYTHERTNAYSLVHVYPDSVPAAVSGTWPQKRRGWPAAGPTVASQTKRGGRVCNMHACTGLQTAIVGIPMDQHIRIALIQYVTHRQYSYTCTCLLGAGGARLTCDETCKSTCISAVMSCQEHMQLLTTILRLPHTHTTTFCVTCVSSPLLASYMYSLTWESFLPCCHILPYIIQY